MSWRQMLLLGAYVGFLWAIWPLPLWRYCLAVAAVIALIAMALMVWMQKEES